MIVMAANNLVFRTLRGVVEAFSVWNRPAPAIICVVISFCEVIKAGISEVNVTEFTW